MESREILGKKVGASTCPRQGEGTIDIVNNLRKTQLSTWQSRHGSVFFYSRSNILKSVWAF